jgi:hypothetical protein
LTGAAYLDNQNGSGWNTASMNYTVDSLTYDLNGNILTMNQHGCIAPYGDEWKDYEWNTRGMRAARNGQ